MLTVFINSVSAVSVQLSDGRIEINEDQRNKTQRSVGEGCFKLQFYIPRATLKFRFLY